MEYKKNCPNCGIIQNYSTKYVLQNSINKNRLCRICNGVNQQIFPSHIKMVNNQWTKNCIKCNQIMTYSSKNSAMKHKNVKCNSCAKIGTKRTDAVKKKLSIKKIGQKNPMFGKKTFMWGKNHTEETKHKLRIATINDLQKKGILPSNKNYNPKACQFIELFGKKNGYNFQHALNGGEVELYGYFVDGYDKQKNIIFEYDEPKHRYNKNKDVMRQNRIINFVNPCMFIRHDELENKTYDVISNKEIL